MQGCVSQVWVVPEVQQGKMYWKADSDAQLTKGLAALLVQGLSGCTPHEVCGIEPDFIEMLGLKQSLTPSRNNGFLNMFRLMQVRSPRLPTACALHYLELLRSGSTRLCCSPLQPCCQHHCTDIRGACSGKLSMPCKRRGRSSHRCLKVTHMAVLPDLGHPS